MFATACCVSLDLKSGRILHANAGHPLPMVMGPDGSIAEARVGSEALGPALGLFGDAQYVHAEAALEPGMRLVFFTDGLTEARTEQQEEFEEEGLMRSLRTHADEALPALLDSIVRDVVEFTGTPVFEDDVCILGIHAARE